MTEVAESSFADHPETLGEARSNRTTDASKWSPRDVLISMLRKIDKGADIDALIVCYRENLDGVIRARFLQSTADGMVTFGLLANAEHRMLERD